MMKVFIVFISMSLFLFTSACDYSSCRSDALDDEDEFVQCDMCNCEGIDDLSDGSGSCSTSNNNMYNCYIKYDREEFTWTCALRMQIGYILMFVFLSMFCCCGCIYCLSMGDKRRRSRRSDSNGLNTYLMRSDVVIVETPYNSEEVPVTVVSHPVVESKPVV